MPLGAMLGSKRETKGCTASAERALCTSISTVQPRRPVIIYFSVAVLDTHNFAPPVADVVLQSLPLALGISPRDYLSCGFHS